MNLDLVRLRTLSRLASELGELDSEWEIERAVVTALGEVFAPTRAVELFLAVEGVDELLSTADGRGATDLVTRLGTGGPGTPLRAAVAQLRAPHLRGADPRAGRGSIMSAPMIVRGSVVGVLVVQRRVDAPDLWLRDLETLCAVAGQVGLALFHVRRNLTARRIRLAEDLEQARVVQRGFLPSLPPAIGNLRVATAYRPAFTVGGDFYDLVSVGEGRTMVVVGDVAGSGVAAALLASRISSAFRTLARDGHAPSQILAKLHVAVEESAPDSGFVTAVCLAIDSATGVVAVASAGHLPVLVRDMRGEVRLHGLDSGVPLGVPCADEYAEERFDLAWGDVLVLTTDGVVEALEDHETPHAMRVLSEIVSSAQARPRAVNRAILAALDAAPERLRADDVTVLTLQLADADEEPLSR
ncbi:MAG: SpoIIE family protein phosphatase [Deltaproteobacteria bacterium]|nr:SpoIIE family protein phosphatase [Deltaproteobacteria bacterium]